MNGTVMFALGMGLVVGSLLYVQHVRQQERAEKAFTRIFGDVHEVSGEVERKFEDFRKKYN